MNLHGILNKGHGRRRVERQVAMLAAIGVAMLGGIAAVATTAQAASESQVWVCKYVGTPFFNETLQSKDGLIRVDANSTGGATVGNSFADKQGRSLVLDVATDANTSTGGGEGEQYTGDLTCPAGQGPVRATATFTAGTCDAEGLVVLSESRFYTWETSGDSHATFYTADPKPGVTLTGQTTFGPFDLTKLPKLDPESAKCTKSAIAALTFTPGTCVAVGSVVATETAAYSWGITGRATARVYTAVAKAGHTLTGRTSWTFNLSKIASTSPACLAPPAVLGVVENAPVVAGVVKSAPVKTLAFTGAETIPLGLSGLLALVLGAVLTVASRQRPKQARE